MNGLIEGVVIALVPIGVSSLGLLIYLCGVVSRALPDLDKRVERLEDWRDGREHRGNFAGEGITS